ncbi:MAG: ATP-binding protein [Thermomicrobiales bacterium]
MELLERTSYLTELGSLLRLAAGGQGRLVFLGGEAGVGKTALARRFCHDAGPTARVLAGACDPLSTPSPLGPLLDIAAAVGGELDHLARTAGPRSRIFGAFLAELGGSPRPALVVIEDAHWADAATLDLLRYLGRRLASIRALLLVTYRDDEVGPGHPLRLVMGDLATAESVRRLTLAPLSVDAVRALAAGSDLDPVVLHRQTNGNAFFVTEILTASAPGIPPTVRDAVLARVARLSAAGRTTLDAAAVIGSPIEPRLLARVVDEAATGVEECLAGGVLRAEGQALAFRHELAREAVHDAIAQPRRQELHARSLAALRLDTSPDPARLAHHAEEANDREAVLAFAPAAAERAAALGAHREAAAQYGRALRFAEALPPERRGALLLARAHECYLTDQMAAAIEACRAALDVWRQVGNRLNEGDSQRRLSRMLWFAGRSDEANQTARSAIALLDTLPPGPQLAMAYSHHAALRLAAWDGDEAVAWGERAIALAESLAETETLVHALNNVGMARMVSGDEQGPVQLERSLRLAREAGFEEHAARAYSNLGVSHAAAYRFAVADDYLTEGITYCVDHDLEHQRLYMLAWHALSLFYQGRWVEASERASAVIRQPRVSSVSRIIALVALGRISVRRGDPQATAILDEALALAEQTGELQRLAPVRAARAEAAWQAGDRDRVLAEARETLDLVVRHQHPWLLGELAAWLWRVGALDTAPPGTIEPFALQIAGDWSGAAARWRALGCPYEAALALVESDDQAAMRSAHAELTGLGAEPAAAIVARRLRELGARGIPRGPRPATRAHPAQLTSREAEILTLIAQGRRNADIAARLYLSPRTVAHHVTAILAKLGVESRTEAAHEAVRLGLIGQNGTPPSPK